MRTLGSISGQLFSRARLSRISALFIWWVSVEINSLFVRRLRKKYIRLSVCQHIVLSVVSCDYRLRRIMVKWNLLHNTYIVLILLEILQFSGFVARAADNYCEQKSACECLFSDGTSINLERLFVGNDGNKFLSNVKDNITIFYHGCVDIKLNISENNINVDHCREPASMCIYDAKSRSLVTLARASLGQFKADDVNPNAQSVTYALNGTSTTVLLVCTPDLIEDQIDIKSYDNAQNKYRLELFSNHACRKVTQHGLSTGSKLLIMFFTFLLVYFVGGASLAYFIRGARGRELIPNVEFWTSLPGLVKDGVVFILSGCSSRLVTTSETYDQI